MLWTGEVLALCSGTRTWAVAGDNRLVVSLFWFVWQLVNVTVVLVFGRDDLEKRGSIL